MRLNVALAVICLVAAAALSLAACDSRPKTAEWQFVCVASHDELAGFVPQDFGNGVIVLVPLYDTVCDREELQCIAGRDGSTRCPDPLRP